MRNRNEQKRILGLAILLSIFVFLVPPNATSVGDISPPELTDLFLTPPRIDTSGGEQVVRLVFSAVDSHSGVGFSQGVVFRSLSGEYPRDFGSAVTIAGTRQHGTFEIEMPIPQFSEQGTWQLLSFSLNDAAGNQQSFSRDDLLALGFTMLDVENVSFTWTRALELRQRGASAVEVAQALNKEFNLRGYEAEKILYAVCYDEEEYLDFTAFESVKRFAPVLKFDQDWEGHGLPMSADTYFKMVMQPDKPITTRTTIKWKAEYYGPSPCDSNLGLIPLPGRDDKDPVRCGMSNNDFQKLKTGQVPTYFRVISDIDTLDEGRLRIAYWWFYGWQPPCNVVLEIGDDGAHHADWEHIMVTTSPNRLKADFVTYYFHDAHYTRKHFELEGERPVVYVGKLGHGSYHSNEDPSCWMLGTPSHCCEYADCRNPTNNTKWLTVQNLISLRQNSESWMSADRIGSVYEYNGQKFIIAFWRWGPTHAYCGVRSFVTFGGDCYKWKFSDGVSTHPTVAELDWTMSSCGDVGCGTRACKGLVYTKEADFDEPWPGEFNMGKRVGHPCPPGPPRAPRGLQLKQEY